MDRRVRWSVLVAGSAALTALALIGDGRLWGQGPEAQPISVAGADSLVYLLELQGQQMGEYAECSGLGSHHQMDERAVVTTTGRCRRQGDARERSSGRRSFSGGPRQARPGLAMA